MTKVSRADIYIKDEKGPSWFDEFLHSLAGNKTSNIQDILDAINNKRNKSIEKVVQEYREQTGLDILGTFDDDDNVKESSIKNAAGLGPISPMKLKKLTEPEDILKDNDESDIIVQVKFDGFKTQAIKSDGVRVYTRRGEDFTENVPDLIKDLESKMKSGSFLLGELVWEDKKGKQSISDIQTVVGSSPEKAKEKIDSGTGTMVFYVYDLLWDNNKDITKTKYIDRYNKLKSTIGKGTSHLKVAENYSYAEKDKATKDALAAGGEGIVLKPKDSEYKYGPKGAGERHGEWAKFKPGAKSHTDEVILKDYSKGKEKAIFPMYQHKGSELFEVGQLSGMSKEDEAKIKKDIDAGKTVVVEITYQERMPSGKFRHVGWSRFRPDKPAGEVKVSEASFKPLSVRQAAVYDAGKGWSLEIEDLGDVKAHNIYLKPFEMSSADYSKEFETDLRPVPILKLFFRVIANANRFPYKAEFDIIDETSGLSAVGVFPDMISKNEDFIADALEMADKWIEQHIYKKEEKMASFKPLSIRHAQEMESIVKLIEADPKLKADIESLCRHSGGTKPVSTIINFIRKKLSNHAVHFTDQELRDYIEKIKDMHRQESDKADDAEPGLAGIKTEDNNEDNTADYYNHGAK